MVKKILVISTSLRCKSNSEALADAFVKGARESGNSVEMITLKNKRIAFCNGCLACQKLQKCVIADDAVEIVQKMHDAEVIVFATPIYYYEMSGQMKTLLDRANPLYPSDYAFHQIYLLTTAAEDDACVPERAINGLNGWIDCFKNVSFAGYVFAGGVNEMGEIDGHRALNEAYELGKSISLRA
jgi:multimeric flavodoxin WrbA